MAMYLKIAVSGTPVIDLLGGDSTDKFALPAGSWGPKVATRREGMAGNRPDVNDVVESIPLYIESDANAATVLANIDYLASLIEQAGRLNDGENVAPVTIQYSPNSDTDYLEALILGPPDGEEAIALPSSFVDDLYQNLVDGVVLRFKRRGKWLGDEESDSSSSVANPGVMTATNTATQNPSPVRLEMTNFLQTSLGATFLIVTDDPDKIDVLTAVSATATGFTSFNMADSVPLNNTSVLQYDPTGTDWADSGHVDIKSLMLSTTRRIGIFANIWQVDAEAIVKGKIISGFSTGTKTYETTALAIGEDYGPQPYYLGTIHLASGNGVPNTQTFQLSVKTNNTTGFLYIDAFVFVDLDNSQIISIPGSGAFGAVQTLYIDHNLLTKNAPSAYLDSTYQLDVGAQGNLILSAQAAEVSALWLSAGIHTAVSPTWCAVTRSTGVRLSNVLTAVRRPAYLVPR